MHQSEPRGWGAHCSVVWLRGLVIDALMGTGYVARGFHLMGIPSPSPFSQVPTYCLPLWLLHLRQEHGSMMAQVP